ncbi:DedA family protein [Novosphingobium sp. ST904]|uniref:DedA family protein n=1 Tax=Novosphingobium sp. ST904 TaxID=1684385 RepID=UPI00104F51B3|nr:DedA family protein [Novosphingobium sp. ST904]TCM35182.1 membrane protein DedA with SNARE-associated domain [Novosphingobium sp. ST904]
MSIETFIAHFGLLAVGLGAAAEGETALMTGGLLAHQGLLPIGGVMAAGAIGSFLADEIFFFLGRHFRARPAVRALSEKPAFARALALLERHPVGFILAFRFLYGLRTVSPIAIGTSSIPARRFIVLNALAATVWGIVIAAIGYTFGQAIEMAFGKLGRIEHVAIAAAGLAVLAAGTIVLVRRRLARVAKAAD